ncbi:MAG: hypothetical protein HC921_01915 [Synechococcaceae cyanobacterium SM2_3_1]|nr:hypothetical protein [Synechococcaceae cyanobacterium SM2_3_1]
MELSVILVCGFNLLLLLALIWFLPVIKGLQEALQVTEISMKDWADAARDALHPAPVELLKLKDNLRTTAATLTQAQQRFRLLRNLIRFSNWIWIRWQKAELRR